MRNFRKSPSVSRAAQVLYHRVGEDQIEGARDTRWIAHVGLYSRHPWFRVSQRATRYIRNGHVGRSRNSDLPTADVSPEIDDVHVLKVWKFSQKPLKAPTSRYAPSR